MSVCDEDASKRPAFERRLDAAEVPFVSDAGIDQRRDASLEEIRIVSGRSGPGRSVVGVEKHWRGLKVILQSNVHEIAVGKRADQVLSLAGNPADGSFEREI